MRLFGKFVAVLTLLVIVSTPAVALVGCMPSAPAKGSAMPPDCPMLRAASSSSSHTEASLHNDGGGTPVLPCCQISAPADTQRADSAVVTAVTVAGAPVLKSGLFTSVAIPAPVDFAEVERVLPESSAQSRLCTFLI